MKTKPIPLLLSVAFGCLILPPQADAQADERIRIMPPFPPFPPPRIEMRVPDVGPMQTREMSVVAKVDGLHATVETTLVFHNPNARLLEGELVFPLPDGAAVCGYALDIGGALVDGVIVTKERARVAFETETRRNVDPGLVERVQGNLYRTRIYPLPANGERRIRLTYTTPLATAANGDAALLLPMPREKIARLNVKIEVAAPDGAAPEVGGLGEMRFQKAEKVWRVESSAEDSTPGEDVLVALPKLPESFQGIEREGDTHRFMITTVAPPAKKGSPEPGKIHVLWDASGSRAGIDLSKEFSLLKQTKATSYVLTLFRDVPEAPREFATVEDMIAAIKDEPFDGGSDFSVLRAKSGERTLLFTDGFDTLSGKALDFGGVTPVAIVSGTVAHREALRQACGGALIDLQTLTPEAAWAEIENPSPRVSGVKGTGIANVQGIGKPAHGRIHLLGELTEAEASVRIQYADGTESEPFKLRREDASEGKVLATAWASARVNQLAPRAEEFGDELLALGRSHGLVSPATSLIVLETLDQWVRHKIEPPASLPDMRRDWQQAMKASANQNDPAPRLEHIAQLWKQRVEWWKSDFSKAKVMPGGGAERDGAADAFSAGDGEANLAPNSPAPAPSGATDPFAAPDDSAPLLSRRASEGGGGGFGRDEAAKKSGDDDSTLGASIEIKPWSPDTPYLKAIRAAKAEAHYTAYLAERGKWAQSPAFFLDCAGLFYEIGNKALARRILTNLAELRIEDAGLLRVLAWRLQQAGELDTATVILRRVAKLRPEEPQSFRDLALALAERGRATSSKADLEEAMQLFLKVALGNWGRHGESIPLFALEEMNALIAWVERKDWAGAGKPVIPDFDKRLRAHLDTDIRIVMSWDADATDMDLHVMEPGGEEAYYAHNRTARGGLVSQDVTDGYGPEEYMIRKAPSGKYAISTNYYGSRQQTVVGPATVTATVFTNWGRANEERQVLTIRLDKEKEKVEIGAITFGGGKPDPGTKTLSVGMTRKQVIALLGKPADPKANPLEYKDGAKTLKIFLSKKGKLLQATETLPGGAETIIVQ